MAETNARAKYDVNGLSKTYLAREHDDWYAPKMSLGSLGLKVLRGPWNPCRAVWCGTCYVPTKSDNYPVKILVTEDGEAVVRRIQDGRCTEGRNGDNLVCPVQYDLCHFRNIKKRDPFSSDLRDLKLLCGIRRANLDAFWARRPGTVKSNLT
jgi:hypothetical protein